MNWNFAFLAKVAGVGAFVTFIIVIYQVRLSFVNYATYVGGEHPFLSITTTNELLANQVE